MHSIRDVEAYLNGLPAVPAQLDRRERILPLLKQLGNPQDTIPAIHIAGTSGKGSTAYYSAALLKQAGYNVGLAVSPYVVDISERTQVDGAPLPPDEYAKYFTCYIEQLRRIRADVTYIECLYMFSFWLFGRLKLDYMVIEVGLGGRLDLTNVMTRTDKTCVITDIGFDHMAILGDTLDKISYEKAGIILPDNDVIMYRQGPEVMHSVRQSVQRHQAHLKVLPRRPYPNRLNWLPLFQQRNCYLAEQAVAIRLRRDHRPLPDMRARKTAMQVVIPGRFEVLKNQRETIILDGAHNPQKIQALIQAVRSRYGSVPLVCLAAFSGSKVDNVEDMLQPLKRECRKIYLTQFQFLFHQFKYAARPDLLQDKLGHANSEINANPKQALEDAREYAQKHAAILIVTGSFYLLGILRPVIMPDFNCS